MFCKKCGNRINDGDRFCARCGEPVEVIEVREDGEIVMPRKKATFKEGIAALFSKTFTFSGRSSRSEFNYGYLFLYLIGVLMSWISLMPVMNELPQTTDMFEITEYITEQMLSNDLSSPYTIIALATTLMHAIFLVAPVYRRTLDFSGNATKAKTYCILFAVGQILGNSLLSSLLGEAVYDILSTVFLIFSLASTVILIMCVFKKSID